MSDRMRGRSGRCTSQSSSRSSARLHGRRPAPRPVAGLTVSIVALPLSMALAIASGPTPDKGLHTAIVAGFLISLLGGSRVQIGGPTAAFVPVVFNVIDKFGYDGLILCTLLAGLMLIAAGAAAHRHADEVHPQAGHHRLHGRHRGQHLLEPGEGSARALDGQGAGRVLRALVGLLRASAEFRARSRRALGRLARDHPRRPAPASHLAGIPDRGDRRRAGGRVPSCARRHDRLALRRHSGEPAGVRVSAHSDRAHDRAFSKRVHDRVPCRRRITAVGRRRRRHDRRSSPLELRARRAGCRERRRGAVRRACPPPARSPAPRRTCAPARARPWPASPTRCSCCCSCSCSRR